jgi:hypothetical protein
MTAMPQAAVLSALAWLDRVADAGVRRSLLDMEKAHEPTLPLRSGAVLLIRETVAVLTPLTRS